ARALPSIWRGRQEAAQGGTGAGTQSRRKLHHLTRDGRRLADRPRAGRRAHPLVGRARAHGRVALGGLVLGLIIEKVMDAATISSWRREVEKAVRAERAHLVQLDAAIGDGLYGINMTL